MGGGASIACYYIAWRAQLLALVLLPFFFGGVVVFFSRVGFIATFTRFDLLSPPTVDDVLADHLEPPRALRLLHTPVLANKQVK